MKTVLEVLPLLLVLALTLLAMILLLCPEL